MDNMTDAGAGLIVLALYVLLNALLCGFGVAIFLVAARVKKSLNKRSERYWRHRQ